MEDCNGLALVVVGMMFDEPTQPATQPSPAPPGYCCGEVEPAPSVKRARTIPLGAAGAVTGRTRASVQ